MEFEEFAARAAEIEAASADTAIREAVESLLVDARDDLDVVARFVQGRVFPAWSSRTLDVGPRLCHEAIARAAGPNVAPDDVEERIARTGDVGDAAASYDLTGQAGLAAFHEGTAPVLTVGEVYAELESLAAAEGAGSQDRKLDALFGLFTRCSSREVRYLARLVLGEMRIGVGGGTVRDAVAGAFDVPVGAVERALQVSNDYGLVAEVARDEGVDGLEEISLEVGRPVRAMLAQAGTVADALAEWDEAVVETKFDGARLQVHYDGDEVALFSRNMEDVTDPLPEIVEFVEAHCRAPAILDGEVVAVDEDGRPLPFQEILRRFRRKHDVAETREEVATELHVFDCLHAPADVVAESGSADDGGIDLLDAPLRERRTHLAATIERGVVDATTTDDPHEIEAVDAAALEAGHEGILLKNPDSAYTPGRRGRDWLKRKPDVETLDLVVTGAEWGEGRRANLFGTFELSVRTEEGFAEIGNVATGMTDQTLERLTGLLEKHVRFEEGQRVEIEPAVVFEVGYEEIQTSPTYESGYALRFPRFAGVREDKDPEDADTLERVERLADS